MIRGLRGSSLRSTRGVSRAGWVEFNRSSVISATERAESAYLYRAGAYTRGAAKRRIHTRKNPDTHSQPGQSPFTHTGLLKRSVAFAVARDERRALIGPAASGIGKLGALHEFGGNVMRRALPFVPKTYRVGERGPVSTHSRTYRNVNAQYAIQQTDPKDGSAVVIVELTSQKQAQHATRLSRRIANAHASMKMVNYKPRPYMAPALASVTPYLPRIWQDSIK